VWSLDVDERKKLSWVLSSTQGLFEDAEAKRGLLVKKADFEAYFKKLAFQLGFYVL
jgi:hypothetical protein